MKINITLYDEKEREDEIACWLEFFNDFLIIPSQYNDEVLCVYHRITEDFHNRYYMWDTLENISELRKFIYHCDKNGFTYKIVL